MKIILRFTHEFDMIFNMKNTCQLCGKPFERFKNGRIKPCYCADLHRGEKRERAKFRKWWKSPVTIKDMMGM